MGPARTADFARLSKNFRNVTKENIKCIQWQRYEEEDTFNAKQISSEKESTGNQDNQCYHITPRKVLKILVSILTRDKLITSKL